jgi:hypothetical protein
MKFLKKNLKSEALEHHRHCFQNAKTIIIENSCRYGIPTRVIKSLATLNLHELIIKKSKLVCSSPELFFVLDQKLDQIPNSNTKTIIFDQIVDISFYSARHAPSEPFYSFRYLRNFMQIILINPLTDIPFILTDNVKVIGDCNILDISMEDIDNYSHREYNNTGISFFEICYLDALCFQHR